MTNMVARHRAGCVNVMSRAINAGSMMIGAIVAALMFNRPVAVSVAHENDVVVTFELIRICRT